MAFGKINVSTSLPSNLWLTTEDGTQIAPLIKQDVEPTLPTADIGQIAAGYVAYGKNGTQVGNGKIVKKLEYGIVRVKSSGQNNRYYFDIPDINISKISAISAVAIADGATAGLTITIKEDANPLGYTITTLSANSPTPIQTKHVISNGVLRLEAFGDQYTKIYYLILEEN